MLGHQRVQLTLRLRGPEDGKRQVHIPRLLERVPGTKAGRVLAGDLGRAEEDIPDKQQIAVVAVGMRNAVVGREAVMGKMGAGRGDGALNNLGQGVQPGVAVQKPVPLGLAVGQQDHHQLYRQVE